MTERKTPDWWRTASPEDAEAEMRRIMGELFGADAQPLDDLAADLDRRGGGLTAGVSRGLRAHAQHIRAFGP